MITNLFGSWFQCLKFKEISILGIYHNLVFDSFSRNIILILANLLDYSLSICKFLKSKMNQGKNEWMNERIEGGGRKDG